KTPHRKTPQLTTRKPHDDADRHASPPRTSSDPHRVAHRRGAGGARRRDVPPAPPLNVRILTRPAPMVYVPHTHTAHPTARSRALAERLRATIADFQMREPKVTAEEIAMALREAQPRAEGTGRS